MIEKIEILQHRESCDFGCHSSEKARWLLGIVAYHHQVVVQLGEDRLNSLSVPLVSPQRRPPVLLVQPVRNFKGDVCRGKQVLLYWSTQISFVAKYHTVMIFPLNILQVMEVMYVGCGHVIGMYDPRRATKGMELVAVVVHVLRGTIAPRWGMVYISLPHRASLSTCILAHLDRFGVNAEHKLSSVNGLGYGLANVLAKQTGQLPTLIELPTGDKIRNSVGTLAAQTGKEIILAVNTECLRCDGECNNLQVGESGNDTTTRNISPLVYLISCILLADFKNFSELCNEVVHSNDVVAL